MLPNDGAIKKNKMFLFLKEADFLTFDSSYSPMDLAPSPCLAKV